MLSAHRRDAIVHCLHGIDAHAAAKYNWPGPVLFAWLRETPAPGHPDPTARAVNVVPLLVEPARWQNEPDGPVAALRQITDEAHHPSHQAAIALKAGRPSQTKALAYLFMYPATVERGTGERVEARIIDAVDTDGTIYVLTRTPGTTEGIVVTADDSDDETITLLRRLISLTYPDGTKP